MSRLNNVAKPIDKSYKYNLTSHIFSFYKKVILFK